MERPRHAVLAVGPTAHAVGLGRNANATPRELMSEGVPTPRKPASLPSESQDGGAKAGPSEPEGTDARSERPAAGCGHHRSLTPGGEQPRVPGSPCDTAPQRGGWSSSIVRM